MVKRSRKKTKGRKTAKKTHRRKAVRKKAKRRATDPETAANARNRKAQVSVYHDLQKKADKAWGKLRHDVKRKAPAHILLEDRDNLLLLLGECNYLAGECSRMNKSRY